MGIYTKIGLVIILMEYLKQTMLNNSVSRLKWSAEELEIDSLTSKGIFDLIQTSFVWMN